MVRAAMKSGKESFDHDLRAQWKVFDPHDCHRINKLARCATIGSRLILRSVCHRLPIFFWIDVRQQAADNVFDGDPFRFSTVANQNPVPEDGVGERADVLVRDMGAARQDRARLAT